MATMVEENNLGMSIEDFLNSSNLATLITKFKAEEIDFQDFLSLSHDELQQIVVDPTEYKTLITAKESFIEEFSSSKSEDESNWNTKNGQTLDSLLEAFLSFHGLGEYYQAFKDEEMDLEDLMSLPDEDLQKFIPKLGHWNKLCRAKRNYSLAEGDGEEFVKLESTSAEVLEEFLKAAGLNSAEYLQKFQDEGIGMEELLDLPDQTLKSMVTKTGPWIKLCNAKRNHLGKNKSTPSTAGGSSSIDQMEEFLNGLNINGKSNDDDDKGEEKKTLNILLLGETGVGKSTFINAFANYLTFETMDEAKHGEILALIASSFSVTDDNFDHHSVSIGEDTNENNSAGQSATQACKSYLFPFDNIAIRLIDTPGIGDTRGIDQDKINLDNILAFIGKHDDLHGICILMKPNNARLTASFSFCIKELLCHLQKDAARNIIFVFTNSRSTFYKPGDTAPTLKAILDQIESSPPHVRIPFIKNTVYCYDNESFRFLMAHNKGIVLLGNQDRIYADSWKISVEECKRMISHIAMLTPHKVKDTVSINEARRLIIELSKPIADIAQNINVNLQVIQDKKEELKLTDADMVDLQAKLKVPVIDLEQRPFTQPRTVCTAPKCIEVRTVGSITKTNYKQRCHDPCYLTGVQAELINNPALMQCAAMGGGDTCRQCGCSYKLHMHIYYECVEIEKFIEDSSIQDLIDKKAGGKAMIAQSIKTLEQRSQDLESERDLLTKATAKFAIFLKSNAIAPYNDAFQDYLEHLISNEKTKNLTAGASNLLVIEGLEKMLGAYKEEKRILDSVMANLDEDDDGANDDSILSAESIKALEQELYNMKINGPRLKQFREGYQASRQKEHSTYSETVHKPPPPKGKGKKRQNHWVNSVWKGLQHKVGNFFS